mmetsp:Transcript_3598/g.10917  ORF Transcript_3598/g.10917 Transcript_3598/m.10917 type:complete len:119 (-) Transcript_3598:326-682(-)
MSKAVEAPKAKRREATRKDEVPRNSKGGVLVTDEELRAAFDFFDVENSGTITLANLRKRLGVFYKNMPAKEYRFLMNNKNEMTLEDLKVRRGDRHGIPIQKRAREGIIRGFVYLLTET